jgi:chitin disaccharide deacetylase
MTPRRLTGLIQNLPEGLSEIYTHPAIGPYPGGASGYLYRDELTALTDPKLKELIVANSIQLGGFSDFITQ